MDTHDAIRSNPDFTAARDEIERHYQFVRKHHEQMNIVPIRSSGAPQVRARARDESDISSSSDDDDSTQSVEKNILDTLGDEGEEVDEEDEESGSDMEEDKIVDDELGAEEDDAEGYGSDDGDMGAEEMECAYDEDEVALG